MIQEKKSSNKEDSTSLHNIVAKNEIDIYLTIRALRPLLIILICIVHLPQIDGYLSSLAKPDDLATLIGPFLKDTFARGAVPMLSMFSGYLAFTSYQNSTYPSFVASKIKRLLIPFFFWNFLLTWIFYASYQNLGYPPAGKLLDSESPGSLLNKIIGIYQFPTNGPLYFLRDLFFISLFIPAFSAFSKNKVLAFVLLILLSMMYTYFPSIKIHGAFLLFRSDIIFFFFLGYYLAFHNLSEEVIRSNPINLTFASIFFLALCIISTLLLASTKPDVQEYAKLKSIYAIFFLLIIPGIASYISTHKNFLLIRWLEKSSPYSFTLFLVHYPVAVLIGYIVRTNSLIINNTSSFAAQIILIIIYLGIAGFFALILAQIYWIAKKLVQFSRN